MRKNLVSFTAKTTLVIGGATGMGAALAKLITELDGDVIVLDVREVQYPAKQTLTVDLRSKSSVDAALAKIEGKVDHVFACAGVADGTEGLMLINFISQRYIIGQLMGSERFNPGGAVVMVSSVAGLPWQKNLPQVMDFLATPSWEEAVNWLADHENTDNYSFSKQAVNAYVASSAMNFLKHGIRINAILPGPTNTPLARANADMWLGFGREYREQVGIEALDPEQIANAMAFLASDAASGVSGVTLLVDAGHCGAALTGVYEEPALQMLV